MGNPSTQVSCHHSSIELDRPSLERELRKAQSIIKQSADAAAISKLNDEVKKLKNELDIMSDYKNQVSF